MQLGRKQVDGYPTERKSHRTPGGRSFACRMDDPPADLGGDRAFRKRLDESARRKQTPFWMPPSQQGLGADYGLVLEPDLRLKINFELVLRKMLFSTPHRGRAPLAPVRAARA